MKSSTVTAICFGIYVLLFFGVLYQPLTHTHQILIVINVLLWVWLLWKEERRRGD